MAKLYDIVSKENKDKLAKIFEQITGKKFKPPKRDKFSGMESLSEISKLMREVPNPTRRE